ncbi:hypothetical protein CDD81_3570 [Ophiocordyceps australis]|uniref:Mitotic checkpoint regulator, MAD2B-interacting-domain-containing protein n=1 Tax=Ophiocordyceps australis TaxID=1399860 RepID=A0A2C5XWW1_9HYPO|nr:hypothetical protein CDD81_3570 [Ophiocordyceps australis]
MGLVEYSGSDSSASDSETGPPVATKPNPTSKSKTPFRKVVHGGKIQVNLGQTAPLADSCQPPSHEPPPKRVRTAATSRFSNFNDLLPPPKPVAEAPSRTAATPSRPGIHLKTSAAPGFSRKDEAAEDDEASFAQEPRASAKQQAEPSIPEGMKPAHEVALVGQPLMFKPLSVARNQKQKNKKKSKGSAVGPVTAPGPSTASTDEATAISNVQPLAPKKASLFSLHTQDQDHAHVSDSADLEPFFAPPLAPPSLDVANHDDAVEAQEPTLDPATAAVESLDTIADDLNLSAAERRELFGRDGRSSQTAKQVINFNLDQEYRHNEAVRAAGDQQIHQPVRAIQSGKHSLKQLVQNVHNQREALEDSFAKGKSNRKEASSRYGW